MRVAFGKGWAILASALPDFECHMLWRSTPQYFRALVSRFLRQACLDLFPGDDIGRVLLMPSEPAIELGALRVRERCRVGLQAFPYRVQQLRFLGGGEGFDLIAQIGHTPLT